ncbi:MAG: RimK family alpha-L-glutamate ligase [Candidatus Hermodarchaeota archaeon]
MIIGIIFNRITWEIKQLINELEKNQIKYELINNQKIYYNLTKDKDLEYSVDVFLERSISYLRGLFSTAILQMKGYHVINNYECLDLTGNKLLTTLKLIENNIPTPKTCIAFKESSALNAIEDKVKYPAILKPIIGSWGRLIAKLDDYNSASANLESREVMGNILQKIYYLQKYIPTEDNKNKPTDIRVIVIGDKCIAAMGRFHPEKDFRSNVAIGGEAKFFEITSELEEICLKASKAVKGEILGVDLMVDQGKFNVIEINGTPQFRGITDATGVNIAGKIVDYVLKTYK